MSVFEGFRRDLAWGEILRRTRAAVREDDCLGLAAELGFFFFLALWPGLLFVVALASFFPVANIIDRITVPLEPMAPRAVTEIIASQLHQISDRNSISLVTLGAAVALWSSSTAMVSIISALNRAFDIRETRAWWKVRLIAIGLTVFLAIFGLIGLTLIMLGPNLVRVVAARGALEPLSLMVWTILRWPIIVLTIVTVIDLVYWAAPNRRRGWRWLTPGSLLAMLLWILTSIGLRTYMSNFGAYVETYGAIGGVMVLLVWLYLFGFVLLLGAELDSEIDQARRRRHPRGAMLKGALKT